MSVDRSKLGSWAARGKRSSSSAQSPAAPAQPSLPAPPPGYGYVFQNGVPVLVPVYAPPQAPPFAPGGAFAPQPMPPMPHGGHAAPGRTVTRNTRLVRPLTKDGVVIQDPWDAALAKLPDLAPNERTQVLFEGLATDDGEAVPSQGVRAPDDPFGRGRAHLRLVADDLKPAG